MWAGGCVCVCVLANLHRDVPVITELERTSLGSSVSATVSVQHLTAQQYFTG